VGVITTVGDGAIEVQGYGAAGASGSPVLDRDGQIVGILYGGRRDGGGQVVFVVPAAGAARLLESQR
jgi:S1-C subfamily serine protease